jgi:hypothetical protein
MFSLLTEGLALTLRIASSGSGIAMLTEIFNGFKDLNRELAPKISLGTAGFEPVAAKSAAWSNFCNRLNLLSRMMSAIFNW